ncbi:MAG: hypothetical protein ACOY0T_01220 [Myxococcota bacterium]
MATSTNEQRTPTSTPHRRAAIWNITHNNAASVRRVAEHQLETPTGYRE